MKRSILIKKLDSIQASLKSISLEESKLGLIKDLALSGRGLYAYYFTDVTKIGKHLYQLDRIIAKGVKMGKDVSKYQAIQKQLNWGLKGGLGLTLIGFVKSGYSYFAGNSEKVESIPQNIIQDLPSAEEMEELDGIKDEDGKFQKAYEQAVDKYDNFNVALASGSFGLVSIAGGIACGLLFMIAGLIAYNKQTGKSIPGAIMESFKKAMASVSSGNFGEATLEPLKLIKNIASSSPLCFILISLGVIVMTATCIYGMFTLLESSQEQ